MKLWVCNHPRYLAEFCGFYESSSWSENVIKFYKAIHPSLRARLSSFKYSYGPRVQRVAIRVNGQDTKLSVEGCTWATHLCFLFSSNGSLPCFKASTCSRICSSSSCSLRAAKRTGSVSAKGQFLSTILGRSGNEG